MTSHTSANDIDTSPQLKGAVNLIDILSRIFKLCIYYPDGNALVDQTATSFIDQLRKFEPEKKTISIKFAQNCWKVEEHIVSLEVKGAAELHKLFNHTAISVVEIEKIVLAEHLLSFAKKLLSWRIEAEASSSFAGLDIDSLPAPIRVRQQEFSVNPASDLSENDGEDSGSNLDNICSNLSSKGLLPNQVDKCRKLLVNLAKPAKSQALKNSAVPHATWEDIEKLLVKVFSDPTGPKTEKEKADRQTDVNTISSIFESLGRGLEDESSKEAIQLLLAHMKGEKEAEIQIANRPRGLRKKTSKLVEKLHKPRDINVFSVNTINKYVVDNNIPFKIQKNLTKVDRSEELAINLQLLKSANDKELLPILSDTVSAILQTPINDREKKVLFGGLKGLARHDRQDVLFELLTKIIPHFRIHEKDGSFKLLKELHDEFEMTERYLLWPYMVNEILAVGYDGDGECFIEVIQRASHLSKVGMGTLNAQLDKQDCFTKAEFADVIFLSSCIFSYPMFSLLIDTVIGQAIADKVLQALTEDPQDKLIGITGPLLNLEIKEHGEFLKSYLLQAHHKEAPLVLRMAAGQILYEFLEHVEPGNRDDEKLPEIILSTAELNCRQTREILDKIINEKKMGMLPVWPKACRKAAWTALKTIQRKKV